MTKQQCPLYCRFPSIAGETLVFGAEDDLWRVPIDGGRAERITANPGRSSFPALSADATQLAFVGEDEGLTEVFVLSLHSGGPARRLTFLGSSTRVLGWDGADVLFLSDAEQAFQGEWHVWKVPSTGGSPQRLDYGPCLALATGVSGHTVLWRNGGGRNNGEYAWWKRYRGGRAGQLWIDLASKGQFQRCVDLDGDLGYPFWIDRRLYFLSDHEGVGNIYSCTPNGEGLERHTHHSDYYVRTPKSDGQRIVYVAGGELYTWSRDTGTRQLPIMTTSSRSQRQRRFVSPSRFVESYELHPEGHSLALVARGRAFDCPLWEGVVRQHGVRDGVRYRQLRWMPDGRRLLGITDELGEDTLTLFAPAASKSSKTAAGQLLETHFSKFTTRVDLGRITTFEVAPAGGDRVALNNHRNEVWVIDLSSKQARQVDKSQQGDVGALSWSPDGRFLAYSIPHSRTRRIIRVYGVDDRRVHDVSDGEFSDYSPRFDPSGRYLYMISLREFNPVYDTQIFGLGFPKGMRIVAIALTRDTPSPFEPQPRAPADESSQRRRRRTAEPAPKKIVIDFDGIAQRMAACPIPEARLGDLCVTRDRLLFTSFPIEGTAGGVASMMGDPPARARLESWDLVDQKRETLVSGVTDFTVSANGEVLAYRKGRRLRVVPVGGRLPRGDAFTREQGWIDLRRLRFSVDPVAEWHQMFDEAWRLQRDFFWSEDMSGVPWDEIRERYRPLLDKVTTRTEFSDVIWEMQGELGTSHAYEMGGDYRARPTTSQGLLGADLHFDKRSGCWRIQRIPMGDNWEPSRRSPLAAPGLQLAPNDRILAVAGEEVGRDRSPQECLVHRGGERVELTVADARGQKVRTVVVTPLSNDKELRYRDWVETNRALTHRLSKNRIGYVHIPDMGVAGFAEFHRTFMQELDYEGLLVDVRYNRGGHVSQLLLEKLLRRRIGHNVSRWIEPRPYPYHSPQGPMAALTNERAGSDGDIFSHAFKLFGLGPLIGTRSWGGVVGIRPRNRLVDGSITTQPESFFWWHDVGFGIENYGAEPDILVENTPRDYREGRDAQLLRGVETILEQLPSKALVLDFGSKPKLREGALPGTESGIKSTSKSTQKRKGKGKKNAKKKLSRSHSSTPRAAIEQPKKRNSDPTSKTASVAPPGKSASANKRAKKGSQKSTPKSSQKNTRKGKSAARARGTR